MDVRARLAELLAERRHGFSLPQAFYTDPAIHEADLQAIFYRRWLFAAASCELAEPGAFVTLTVGRSPILLLRDEAARCARSSIPAGTAARVSSMRRAASSVW